MTKNCVVFAVVTYSSSVLILSSTLHWVPH